MRGNRYPDEPYYTCNAIDEAIASLDTLREQNEALRDWGRGQAERADELEAECDRLREREEELEAIALEQEGKIRDLRLRVEQAEEGEL